MCFFFMRKKNMSLWPQGDDYGKYGVTQSNLKRAESHLKSSLQSAKVEAWPTKNLAVVLFSFKGEI